MREPDHPAHPLRGGVSPVDLALEIAAVRQGDRGRAALAIVVGRSGSAPQIVGARLLLHEDGSSLGTVGGGAIEAQVLDACRHALRDGRSRKVEAHLVRDLAMCCGGTMEVFVEHIQPAERLILIGGGHVAQALAPIATAADFRLTVLDDRDELLEHPAFAGARADSYDVDELGAALPDLSDRDFVLIMTRDHARDETALRHLLTQPHRYLGMIGSRRKVHTVVARVVRRFDERGTERPDLSRLRAPIGLSLGGRTPAEIAVSIVAELIAIRHGGNGDAMSVVEAAAQGKGDHDAAR